MFASLKARIVRLLGGTVPGDDPDTGTDTKAARGQTMTTFMSGGVGTAGQQWSDWDTQQHNTGWVFASSRAIAQRIAGQGIRVGRRVQAKRTPSASKAASDGPPWLAPGSTTELTTHPLIDSFDDPNPYCTAFDLLDLTVRSLLLTGLAYLWIDEQPDDVTRLWYLPAGWVRSDPEEDEPLTQFIIQPAHSPEQFKLDASELVRFAMPDPANPLNGLGILKAGALAVRTDEEIQTAQLVSFRNRSRPGMLVKVNQAAEAGGLPGARPVLTRQQREGLRTLINQAYSGTLRHGEPLILDGFIEEVKFLFDGQGEMDFRDSSAITKERITQLFGTNPIVMGQVEGANRASAVVADENFCFSTCRPIAVKIGQTLTKWLRVHHDDPSLVVWVPPPEPRDPDGRRADLDQLIRAGSIKVNELRAEHGLPPDPDGDRWVKAGPQNTTAPEREPETQPQQGDGKGVWDLLDDREKRAVLYRAKGSVNGHKVIRE